MLDVAIWTSHVPRVRQSAVFVNVSQARKWACRRSGVPLADDEARSTDRGHLTEYSQYLHLSALLKFFDQHKRLADPRHGAIDHPALVRRHPEGRSSTNRDARWPIEMVNRFQCGRA